MMEGPGVPQSVNNTEIIMQISVTMCIGGMNPHTTQILTTISINYVSENRNHFK